MIRPAVAVDARQIAAVQHRAWWRAYPEYVDPERFGTLDERVGRWHEHLAAGASRRTLVFDQDGQVAGFASYGPARDDDVDCAGELQAVYVDPPAQGAGVGGALLSAAEARLRLDGYRDAVLWVFTRNEAARRIYERRGWELEPGRTRADVWAPAVRYRLALEAN